MIPEISNNAVNSGVGLWLQDAVCSICKYARTCLMIEHVCNNSACETTAVCKLCIDGVFIRASILDHIISTCEEEERRIQRKQND